MYLFVVFTSDNSSIDEITFSVERSAFDLTVNMENWLLFTLETDANDS